MEKPYKFIAMIVPLHFFPLLLLLLHLLSRLSPSYWSHAFYYLAYLRTKSPIGTWIWFCAKKSKYANADRIVPLSFGWWVGSVSVRLFLNIGLALGLQKLSLGKQLGTIPTVFATCKSIFRKQSSQVKWNRNCFFFRFVSVVVSFVTIYSKSWPGPYVDILLYSWLMPFGQFVEWLNCMWIGDDTISR